MLKMLINEEEVVSNKDFTIKKEMLNTPSVILNNVYPKTWEEDKDYTSRFYHPNDYSKCKIVDETYIPPEEGTTVTSNTGEIYITDADNTKENDYKVQGKAEQHSYSGKNLLNLSNIASQTLNGITFTPVFDDNGCLLYVNASGAASNTVFYRLYTGSFLNAEYIYHAIYNEKTGVSSYTADGNDNRRTDNGNGVTIPSSYSIATIWIRISIGTTLDNYKFYPMLRLASIEDDTYEPYVGGIPSPNPDYPQEIKSVSGIGNILPNNATTTTINGVTLTVNDDKSITLNGTTTANVYIQLGTFNVLRGETLTISGVTGYTARTLQLFTESTTAFPVGNRLNCSNGAKTVTALGDENNLSVGLYAYSGNTYNNVIIYPMIEKGSVAHQYVPYGHWLPVKVSNKNLFDKNYFLNHEADFFNSVGKYFKVIELGDEYKTQFTASISLSGTSQTEYALSFNDSYGSSPSTNSRILTTNGELSNRTYDFTNAEHVYMQVGASNSNYTVDKRLNDIFDNYNIQVEKSSTATDYIEHQEQTTLIDLNKYDENNNIVGNYELCSIRDIKDLLTIKDGKAIINKDIEKLTFNGTETIQNSGGYNGLFQIKNIMTYPYKSILGMSNYFTNSLNMNITDNSSANNYLKDGQFAFRWNFSDSNRDRIYFKYLEMGTDVDAFKTWLSTHNTEVYYQLPATETITLRGTYDINLYEGVNHISIVDDDLIPVTTLHYNYVNEQTITDLLFCGVVKNSGNISLNPRYPHYSTLQILDFKNFLSEGELDAFVISNKTILETIQMVIDSISSYGFVLGNINILNPNEIIGAYSTKDKSAYDVFSYIADITQSRWTTRVIDENTVAIDFYDPSLMEQGTTIEYTQEFFKNNLIDDMDYSYGTNDYRNKQIMTSNQVYSNISQSQSIVANGYQTQFQTEQPLGQIISITSDGKELTFATNNAKELGFTADFYYTPGNNYFESADLRATGEVLNIEYMAIVEGRQIITNPNEIQRVADSTNRKGIVTRYENRNDAITSNELQLIGQSYIKYKGTPEIVLKIKSRSNIWEVGQRVQFNAPIDELNTEYMVRSKEINHIATTDTIFYTYELTSSFNSETAINYFDNQRAKAKGNIGEGEYISRNVDVESTANIIFYDTQATEVTITGDNSLNSVLNAPFIN